MFAIRNKLRPYILLGMKFYKNGNEYFPVDITTVDLENISDSNIYTDSGEYFEGDYNETTLVGLIDRNINGTEEECKGLEHSYSRKGLLEKSIFVADEWEVVKLSLSVVPLDV